MKLYRIRRAQRIPSNLNDAWEFFSHPNNMIKVMPPNLRIKIIERQPRFIYSGMLINQKVKTIFGIKRSWITQILHEDEPNYFVDEQKFGPFRFWHHQHIFTEVFGGIEVEDIIHYSLPFGILGRLFNAIYIKKKLKKIFDYRAIAIKKLFDMPITKIDD